MKLKLVTEGIVQILVLTEGVTSKDVEIIKAGVKKLLKNGKNKIVLELEGIVMLPDDVIRDIGIMDNIASELSGRIVIVTANPELKKKLNVFAGRPLVLCFPDRKSAIATFSLPIELDERQSKITPLIQPSLASPTPVPSTPAQPPAQAVGKAPAPGALIHEPTKTSDEALAREVGGVGQIRFELAELKKENQILQDQLLKLVENRRQTVDSPALLAKIRALELEVEKLLVATPPKKA